VPGVLQAVFQAGWLAAKYDLDRQSGYKYNQIVVVFGQAMTAWNVVRAVKY
jgi:hypothetical protein